MDTSGVHLWLILWKAYEACRSAAEQSILGLDMCYSDFAVLECLLHKGPLPINEIGEKISLTSSSITTAIDRLEQRKLVERSFTDRDRRARIVTLTPDGKELIEDAFERHERELEALGASLNTAERRLLISLLKKVGSAATQLHEDLAASQQDTQTRVRRGRGGRR